jgi:hypothetical protein
MQCMMPASIGSSQFRLTIDTFSRGCETRRLIVKFAARIAVVTLLASVSSLAQTKQTDTSPRSPAAKLEQMPESLELRYAVSALPPHLRDGATIYILDPAKGYVLNIKGTNGMTCVVVRSDWQYTVRPFRDDIFWPVCYDAEGSKTLLQDYMYAAELRAHGMEAKEVHTEVTKKFGTAAYPNPARAGIAYMLSPIMRTFGDSKVVDPFTMNMPHYMFYAPNVKNADIGGKPFSQYPFILSMSPGRDDVIILFAGETEKAKILSESKDLLTELCSYRDFLCTNERTRTQIPTN